MLRAFIKDANFGISVLLIALAIGVAAITLPVFGNRALIVKSGSMQPTIKVGDLVAVQSQKGFVTPQDVVIPKYKIGDIIAFKNQLDSKIVTTHRIVSREVKGGKVYYQTRGDANNSSDNNVVLEENIIGRADYSVKGIGKLFSFAKSRMGLSLLVIFPALMVIVIEFANLLRELKRNHDFSNQIQFPSSTGIKVLIPILAVALTASSTFAFFSKSAASTGNIFSASQAFPTPTPSPSPTPPPIANHLVINEVYYDVDQAHQIDGQGGGNRGEWIEIYNPTTSDINVNGFIVDDDNSSETLPNVSIPSHGFLILSGATQTELQGAWTVPAGTLFALATGGKVGNGFDNSGDLVRLKNSSNSIIDQMSYGGDTSVLNPAPPDVTTGHSLERDPDGVDTDTKNDFVDRATPTPGS